MSITAYHAKYYAYELTKRHADRGVDRLSQSLFDASVDLNPHQIEAALFAMRNPLQQGHFRPLAVESNHSPVLEMFATARKS